MSKTVPVAGTSSSVTFFEDDSLETVRQHIAVAVNSHPDRLFIEAHVQLPEEHYEDPRHWDGLFLRLSPDGVRLDMALFKEYLEHKRPGTGVKEANYSREDWHSKPDALKELFEPGAGFSEWRVFGVTGDRSFVLPLPPKDLATLQPTRIPVGNLQLLFETLYADVAAFRAIESTAEASQLVKRVYFPMFREDTPSRLTDSAVRSLKAHADQLTKLLALDVPEPKHPAILRAKWYVPLAETEFTAPRARFEQVFYGLTLSKKSPYIGFFTSKQEKTRHKFYVENPDDKVPSVDMGMWKSWTSTTLPQRRLPTLLLYRGTSRTSFDRIAITPRDIQFTIVRGKETKGTLDEFRVSLYDWIKSLDAVTPFIEPNDLAIARWELQDLSILGVFPKAVDEFDMRRFPCLQTLFSYQDETFRLLRADRIAENFTPLEVQAFQALQEADQPSAATLTEIGVTPEDAEALFTKFANLGDDLDLERVLKGFPKLRFSNKEVILSAVTTVERAMKYASILRHVLTSDDPAVEAVCPRRVEAVEATAVVPQQVAVYAGDFQVDDDFLADLGLGEAAEAAPAPEAPEAPVADEKKKRIRVREKPGSTYNYFNKRLQDFDPETFDNSVYPEKCDKNKQVVVLTPEDEARIPAQYNPRNYPETEKQKKIKEANVGKEGIESYNVHVIELAQPEGIATCPQYWCMTDQLPLREDQLVNGGCPVCNGKVRTGKDESVTEFSVIKRDQSSVFPKHIRAIKNKDIPCCYKEERGFVVLPQNDEKTDDSYILSTPKIPAMRMGYIPDTLASSLKIPIKYATTIKKNRLDLGKSDFFRVGLGRPSKTVAHFLKHTDAIPSPKDARKSVLMCSFTRTWTDLGEGDTQLDRIVSGVDDAYKEGRMSLLDELEYVTAVIGCKVIRVDTATNSVKCGFWSERLAPHDRTIVVVDQDILAHVARSLEKLKGFAKYTYTVNVRDALFPRPMLSLLTALHSQSCASDRPRYMDAVNELRAKGAAGFQVILDPFERVQAVFVPNVTVLPVQPTAYESLPGVQVRSGYADIRPEELPTRAALRSFLDGTSHKGFKWVEDLRDVQGRPVESLLASEFRAPFQPDEAGPGDAKEALATMARHPETLLTDGKPNAEDILQADSISYQAEVFDFLMFSLSKDIQREEYSDLREGVASRGKTLYKQLDAWLKKEAHWDATQGPRAFVNKVRTPCGQFQQKDACTTSSLCGWKAGKCKIKVDSSVDRTQVLRRLAKTLAENDKQRALILDDRMTPFFSTVLYMEMPHELITTTP